MLRKIGFENYKSFKNYTELEIKPITVLVGPNSAGKSSIIKLIKLLAQSYKEKSKFSFLNLSGSYLKVSSFASLLFNKNKSLKIDLLANPYLDEYESLSSFNKDSFTRFTIELKENKVKFKMNMLHVEESNDFYDLSFDEDENEQIWNKRVNHKKTKTNIISYKSNYKLIGNNGVYTIDVKRKLVSRLKLYLKKINVENNLKELISVRNKRNPEKALDYDKVLDNLISGYGKITKDINGFSIPIINELDIEPQNPDSSNDVRFFSKRYGDSKFIKPTQYNGKEIRTLFNNSKFIDLNNSENQKKIKMWLNDLYKFFSETTNINEKGFYFYEFLNGIVFLIENIDKKLFEEVSAKSRLNTDFNITLDYIFRDFKFVPPIRDIPKQYYSSYELTNYLKSWDNEVLSPREIKEFTKSLNQILADINLELKIDIEQLSKSDVTTKIYSIIIDQLNKVNLTDVGYGTSQLLPILYVLSLTKWGLSIIEQPELHLHPNIQFNLASVFSNVGLFFPRTILETHSEHLIRGFQVEVAKGNLKKDNIAIYYVSKDAKGVSSIKEMKLDDKGMFLEKWPKGFFDVAYNASKELLSGWQS